MHLLVVEDEEETATTLSRDLANCGHSVVIARDGRDAIFYAGDQDFDAVVLDRMLPLIDGLHVMKRLRNGANVVPILMLDRVPRRGVTGGDPRVIRRQPGQVMFRARPRA